MIEGRPNDTRGFIHRTIGRVARGAAGFLTGGISDVIIDTLGPGGRRPGRCPPGSFPSVDGSCVQALNIQDPEDIVSGSPGFGRPSGEAVLGRYGAALQPFARPAKEVRFCLPGMVLGNDGLCYNRRELANKSRMWPRGRRPLLTGGDMRAITQASAAAKKLQAKQKQLQNMGMLKRPAVRRAPTPKLITAGPRIVNIDND